jgi:hypothetical protein
MLNPKFMRQKIGYTLIVSVKLWIILLFLFLLPSCSNKPYRNIKFKSLAAEHVYSFSIPSGGKIQKNPTYKRTGHTEEYRVLYNDSSVVYIIDDNVNGANINLVNCWGNGHAPSKKYLDTVNYEGQQHNGKYWRQSFVGPIVVGYINVSKENKELFDNALLTIHEKK